MTLKAWEILNAALRVAALFALAFFVDGCDSVPHFALIVLVAVYLIVMIVGGVRAADALGELEEQERGRARKE